MVFAYNLCISMYHVHVPCDKITLKSTICITTTYSQPVIIVLKSNLDTKRITTLLST